MLPQHIQKCQMAATSYRNTQLAGLTELLPTFHSPVISNSTTEYVRFYTVQVELAITGDSTMQKDVG